MAVRHGGSGNDLITGTNAVDTIFGEVGNDRLYGLSGNDSLFGGSGWDTLFGGEGSDTFYGGSGSDAATAASDGADSDTLRLRFFGGTGSDRLAAYNTVNDIRFFGGTGNDTLFGSIEGAFTLEGGDGDDRVTLAGSVSDARLLTGSGSDTVVLNSGAQELGEDDSTVTLIGSGRNVLSFDNTVSELFVRGGAQGDSIFGAIQGDVDVSLGLGDDRVTLDGSVQNGLFYLGSGSDTVALYSGGQELGEDDSNITLIGSGRNVLAFDNTVNELYVRGGDQGDSIFGAIEGDVDVSLGLDDDRVTLDGSVHDGLFDVGSGSDTVALYSGGQDLGEDVSDLTFIGSGRNVLSFDNTFRELAFTGGDNGNSIFGELQGKATLGLGLSNDRVSLSGSVDEAMVYGGSGADTLSVFGSSSDADHGTITFIGSGANDLSVYGTVEAVFFQGGNLSDRAYGAAVTSATLNLEGGNDTVTLDGGPGSSQTVYGGSGIDRIRTSDGDDTVRPGSGVDTAISTESGNDLILVGSGEALAGEILDGGSGIDTLGLILGAQVPGSATLFGIEATITLGTSASDTILGDAAENSIYAFTGNDTVYGDGSNDRVYGDVGDDELHGGDKGDRLFGEAGSDELLGDDGNDRLYGGNAGDTLRGGNGRDSVFGGKGNDLIIVRPGESTAGEVVDGGAGNDTLRIGTGADLPDDITSVEVLEAFGGNGRDRFTGFGGADSLYGNGGNDTLFGDQGADTLVGGSGKDKVFGGGGNDRFLVGSGESESGETYDGGAGTDTLILATGVSLASGVTLASIESLSAVGSNADDSFSGFSGSDDLSGRDGNDVLRGQTGDDSLFGGSGKDTLFGAEGDDTMDGGSGNDVFVGGTGSDTLFGGEGRDRLNGASGTDTAYGGDKDDTFIIDTKTDRIFDGTGQGDDVLRSNATNYTLGTVTEVLIERANINTAAGDARMVGADGDDLLIGNSFSNVLMGKSGNDRLNSHGGGDKMTGGSGDDTFIVATPTDVVREFDGQGTDLVRAEVDFTLPNGGNDFFVENLRLEGGFGNIDGRGNNLDNTLEGNTGDNRLEGRAGDDHLEGGEGADTLYGGGGEDRLEGEGGDDTLYLTSGDAAFGGGGKDDFLFDGDSLGSAGSGGPLIRDFDGELANAGNGQDKLVFATGLETGSFAYIGAAAFSGSGNSEARFDGSRQIQVDQDGDGTVDQAFLMNGVTAANLLTATDFVWL